MFRKIDSLIIFAFLFFGTAMQAQNIQIKEDPVLADMMQQFIDLNKSKTSVEGYRIQILATTDRQRLESVKQGFQYRYPNVAVDWIQTPPYYKLRAGAFATKLEALRLLHILKRDYSNAYLAIDKNIKPYELIGSIY
ncbi:MAG: SPOR domain-containing protein [Saprospiraceae bacterium]|nr:SPOR domain-containing protein [Saprospiraceae bacterium]